MKNISHRKIFIWLLLVATVGSSSCAEISTGDQLSPSETKLIKQLGQLNKDEKIYQFYSNNGIKGAGNYYTSMRIGRYWRNHKEQELTWAYYKDVARINIDYNPSGDFVIPFLLITRKDSTQFKVFVDGEKPEVTAFFNNCCAHWKAGK